MPKHTRAAAADTLQRRSYKSQSERMLREYFVRCSHGTAATHARAAAVGVLLVLRPQADGLDQRPVLEHVQVRVQCEVHGQQHVRGDVERPNPCLVLHEPGQRYRYLPWTTRVRVS